MNSLRTKILCLAVVLLACLGGAFIFYSDITTRIYKRLRLEVIEMTTVTHKEGINKIIATMERGAISLSREGLWFFRSQSIESGENSAIEYLSGLPASIGSGIWFEPYMYNTNTFRFGVYAYYDRITGETRLYDMHIIEHYDYHNMSWYREIADEITSPNQVVWTKPYIDETSFRLITTAGAGVFDDHGRMIGIAVINWSIGEMIEQLSAIKPTENSFVVLSDPIRDYIIIDTLHNAGTGESLDTLEFDINVPYFTLNNMTYRTFNQVMDNGWLLGMYIPEDEIFSEVETQNYLFSMAMATLTVILLFFTFRLISELTYKPIMQLVSDVTKLTLGNLNTRVAVTSNDEIGLLAGAFNQMAGDLQKSIEAYTGELAEKEQVAAEINVAAGLQIGMLPHTFPPFPGRTEFNLYASMLPAKMVGGDFYDFFLVDDDTLAVVIADVSGNGIPAALFMVTAKTLINNYACSGKSPREVFEAVNNTLCQNNDAAMFVTAFMGYYHTVNGRFRYINAGHNPPFIRKNGHYAVLESKPNLFLAYRENVSYQDEEIYLKPTDALYLYTDGVTDAMNTDEDFFTDQRLFDALAKYRHSSPQELLSGIKMDIDQFASGADQADDITMLALEINHLLSVSKKLMVQAYISNLDEVLSFINEELDQHTFSESIQNDINIAVEEVFVNIAHYAYDAGTGNVELFIAVTDEAVIKFEDSGKPYNPLTNPDPDFDTSLMDREIGGLGVYLVKKLMDTVSYSRLENKNVLVMSKKLKCH